MLRLPKEHLLKLIQNKCTSIEQLYLLPESVMKALRSLPMPWINNKRVSVYYNTNGAIAFINDNFKISEKKFKECFTFIESLKKSNMNQFKYPFLNELKYVEVNTNLLKIRNIKSNFQIRCNLRNKRYFTFEIPIRNRLTKNKVKINKNNKKSTNYKKGKNKVKLSKNYLLKTEMNWIEAMYAVLICAHKLLNNVLKYKNLGFMEINIDFNIVYKRKITTKERKQSRLGSSFNIIRELCKLLKYVYDTYVVYYEGKIDVTTLSFNLNSIFCNVSNLTTIYRYRFKIMKFVKKTSKRKNNVIFTDNWRVWIYMLRGYKNLLKNNLYNFIHRDRKKMTFSKINTSDPTKFDVTIKELIFKENKELIKNRNEVLKIFNCKWKNFKCCKYYNDEKYNFILDKYIKMKIEWYLSETTKKLPTNKKQRIKQLGRILRLHIHKFTPLLDLNLKYNYYISKEVLDNKLLTKLYFNTLKLFKRKVTITTVKGINLYKRVFKFIEIAIKFITEPVIYYKIDKTDLNEDLILNKVLWESLPRFDYFISKEEFNNLYKENCYIYNMNYCSNISLNIMRKFLLVMFENKITDYIISRFNSIIMYKDIEYTNKYLINGIPFITIIHYLITVVYDYYLIEEGYSIKRYFNKIIIDKNITENTLLTRYENKVDNFEIMNRELRKNSNGKRYIDLVDRWNNILIKYIIENRIDSDNEAMIYGEQMKFIKCLQGNMGSKNDKRYNLFMFYGMRKYGGLGMFSIKNLYKEKEFIPSIVNYLNYNNKDTIYDQYLNYYKIYWNVNVYYDYNVKQSYEMEFIKYNEINKNLREYTLYEILSLDKKDNEMKCLFDIPKYFNTSRSQKRGCLEVSNRKFMIFWSPLINRSNIENCFIKKVEDTEIKVHGKIKNLEKFYKTIFRNNLWFRIKKSFNHLKKLVWSDVDTNIQNVENVIDLKKTTNINNKYISLLIERIHTFFNINISKYIIDIELYDYDVLIHTSNNISYLYNKDKGMFLIESNNLIRDTLTYCNEHYKSIVVEKKDYHLINEILIEYENINEVKISLENLKFISKIKLDCRLNSNEFLTLKNKFIHE
ncbi:PRP8 [Hepatospora eriocheir]|uniref:PRP8 n=1 Tax=Hepatospora eriocheir TaxID=1081669 RepID=A0A1X0QIV2_9MICR|nr:PRP8 [Hepatospora eriocheir]